MVDNSILRFRLRVCGSLACLLGSSVAGELRAQPTAPTPTAQAPGATAPGNVPPAEAVPPGAAPAPAVGPAAPAPVGLPEDTTAGPATEGVEQTAPSSPATQAPLGSGEDGGGVSGTNGVGDAANQQEADWAESAGGQAEAEAAAVPQVGAEDDSTSEESIDLDALLASDSELPGDEYRLQLYGFTDFTFNQPLADQSFLSPYSTFWVGNFNLYIGSELGRNWRTLAEVRFTYLPHGQAPYVDTTQPRIDTQVGDYADYDRPMRWGGVEIERAWVEYTANNWLSVRAGQWLTPYGIWNVDHGSPVIVGVVRPYVVGDALFPERQTGIQFHGGTQLGGTQLGYHLTVSNGRGPIDSYRDLDNNKALGWRLFMRNESSIGAISLGFSGYWGRFTDSLQEFVPDGEAFKLDYNVQTQFDELALAGDLKYEVGDYFLQSEVISNSSRFTEEGRPVAPSFVPGAPNGFAADMSRWGVYGLTGYRTPWLGIMPFAGAEYYRFGTSYFPLTAAWYVGLNVRPIPRVVLKAQYTHSWYPDNEEFDGARLLAFQAAWSF